MTSSSPRTVIRATGMSVPQKVVTNADFERLVDTFYEGVATDEVLPTPYVVKSWTRVP